MSYVIMFIGWALAGWCGTGPKPGPWPLPEPDPGPNPWRRIFSGIIGGMAGGLLFHLAFPADVPLTGGAFALTCIGAYIMGFVLSDFVGSLKHGRKRG